MRELKDTVALMLSKDYKDKFKAEYYQLSRRYIDLCKELQTINKMEEYGAGKKITQETYAIMVEQLNCMEDYLECLKKRAKAENIELEVENE